MDFSLKTTLASGVSLPICVNERWASPDIRQGLTVSHWFSANLHSMVVRSLMKRTSLTLITTALLIALPAQSFAATKASVSKPKLAGRTVSAIPNTILSGTTPPSSAIGIDGDFYIDVKNANIYGPKSKGKWLTKTSLRGIAGVNGLDGKNGSDAKNISTASSTAGPQGIQGEKGATGSSGAQGSIGATGSSGAQGPAGASGSGTGPTGAKGDTGLTGLTGNPGAKGDTGLAGSAGSIGPKGETGTVGSTGAPGSAGTKGETGTVGPSISYFVTIPSWSLSTASPSSSNSAEFGTLQADAVYNFQIILDGTFATTNSSAYYFNAEVLSNSPSSTILSQVFVSDSRGYVNGVQSRHYMFNIIGTISTGSASAKLLIRMSDIVGITGAVPLSITGKAILNLVGQIG